jgi:hypothetical protein
VNERDLGGSTPLFWAAASEQADPAPVRVLLAAGADVHAVNKMNETALDWALRRGNTPVVSGLKSAGAQQSGAASQPAGPVENALSDSAMRDVRAAIGRGVESLHRSGPKFFKQSGCVSCHHQALPLEASALAHKKGIPVDSQLEAQQVKSILAVIKPARPILLENTDVIPDIPVTVPYLLMALAAQGYAADRYTDAAVHNLAGKQMEDGSWIGWAPRGPSEHGDIQATALSVRALNLYGIPGRKAEFQSRIAKAREWLRRADPVTTEEKVMKLFGLAWSHAPEAEIRKAASAVRSAQRPDGGWGQLATLPSDAYATGKALVALHEAAKMEPSSGAYRRGVEYLLGTQGADGTWHVKTRAFPFQPLKDSGFPHGRDQWISATGTGWAAMALAYSL